jgi:hypothetical protein
MGNLRSVDVVVNSKQRRAQSRANRLFIHSVILTASTNVTLSLTVELRRHGVGYSGKLKERTGPVAGLNLTLWSFCLAVVPLLQYLH